MSIFQLFRLRILINNELKDPNRIKTLRKLFQVGDRVQWFDSNHNKNYWAEVLEKKQNHVEVRNEEDGKVWEVQYYTLNLEHIDVDLVAKKDQKLTKNHFHAGERVSFNHDGKIIHGTIERLNQKTVSLRTPDHHKWRVAYCYLEKVIDGEVFEQNCLVIE